MSRKLSEAALRRLPKCELHQHLDGSVRPETVLDLAITTGVELPTLDLEELRGMLNVGSQNCPSLVEYLKAFDITLSVMQYPEQVLRITYEVCEDAAKDGVRYLELRFSPELHVRKGMSLTQVMKSVIEGKLVAESRHNIMVRILVIGMRNMSTETKRLAEIAWRYQSFGVTGFDLAGPEEGFSSRLHREAFDIIRAKNLNCTIHGGEASSWRSVRDSIRYCGAQRIGHGVALRENDALLEYAIDRRIPVEVCVTSNTHTKSIANIAEHPLKSFFDRGVLVVPCTDNTTMSNCSLSSEYHLIQNEFGLEPHEILKIVDYGYRAAFIPTLMKFRMRAEAFRMCLKIFEEDGVDMDYLYSRLQRAYWDPLGVDYGPVTASSFWRGNPDITPDIVNALPKADLHCRLDGSISVQFLFEQLKETHASDLDAMGVAGNIDALKKLIVEDPLRAKGLMAAVLQTKDQIELALKDILTTAAKENVQYMELFVCPRTHEGILTTEEVMSTVCSAISALEKEIKVKVGVVVYGDFERHSPLTMHALAQLAVRTRDEKGHVIGFAALGSEDLPEASMRYFEDTFNYLKDEMLNCVISAGKSSEENITPAIHHGGATRISGGFKADKSPNVVAYLAGHRIPVETAPTNVFNSETKEVASFTNTSPLRLLLDNDVPVAICSFNETLNVKGRSEMLYEVISSCNLSIAETLELLMTGFRHNFQPHSDRAKLLDTAFATATSYLRGLGFSQFYQKRWFP